VLGLSLVRGRGDLCSRLTTLLRVSARPLVLVVAFMAAALCAGGAALAEQALRVCADPNNLPFSNEKGDGFENKLAELIAERLGARLDYAWFSEATGYVPNTMGSGACDLVMGYAQGTGLIDDTNPYYYASYVLVYRHDDASLAGVDRLSDPRLKGKAIGYFPRTPAASLLAMHGLMANAKPFEMPADKNTAKSASAMIGEVASGGIDAAVLWGPLGGYYAQYASAPLDLVPLVKETAGPPVVYGITMGVRPNDPQWKHKINKLIAENQAEIYAILASYNVPVLDDKGNLIAAAAER
jgi:mxaJ protein